MPDPTETHEVLVETFDQPANRLALPPSAERRDTTSRELVLSQTCIDRYGER